MKIDFLLNLLGERFSEGNLFTEFHELVREQDCRLTANAILERQSKFLLESNVSSISSMFLRDIKVDTGLDIAIISRATKDKYFYLDGKKIYLKSLFNGCKLHESEMVFSQYLILEELKRIVTVEYKDCKISDKELTLELNMRNIPLKIRTTNKYRNKLGLPCSTARRKK